ncbi:hypothetical protein IKL45_03895 [Candidatus Saccharibacteria bacterium]|nr:hypothetical protein [Candidatus Saccharibacteria bacterium]MBR6122204.1 hypothetical protein [Candidatus Saccharibacteria bacterium]
MFTTSTLLDLIFLGIIIGCFFFQVIFLAKKSIKSIRKHKDIPENLLLIIVVVVALGYVTCKTVYPIIQTPKVAVSTPIVSTSTLPTPVPTKSPSSPSTVAVANDPVNDNGDFDPDSI